MGEEGGGESRPRECGGKFTHMGESGCNGVVDGVEVSFDFCPLRWCGSIQWESLGGCSFSRATSPDEGETRPFMTFFLVGEGKWLEGKVLELKFNSYSH